MSVEEDDLRGVLEKSWEEHEQSETHEDSKEPVQTTPTEASNSDDNEQTRTAEEQTVAPDAEGRARGPDGKFLSETKKGEPGKAPEEKPPLGQDSLGGLNAPVGWKAAAKSEWAKIPRAAQEEISRRETEVAKTLNQSTAARKHFDDFNQVVAPFMPLIRAQNSTPLDAVRNLMTTSAGLTVGSPEQKARIVRDIIANFGVDLQLLDQVLSQNLPQGGGAPGTSNTEIAIQRALSPVYDFMNSIQQQRQTRQQQMAADADRTVEEFAAKNEFFEELREDIADLMEMHAARGRELTLQRAYEMAVSMNSEINAVVQQRKAASRATNTSAVAKARHAASSIRGNPVGDGAKPEASRTIRDDLMDAWENSGQ